MSRIKYLLDNFEEFIIAVLLILMVVVIFIGTVGRYSQLFLLPWAEEFARYMMIWMVFLGIGAGAKRNAHFLVEILRLLLPERLQKYLRVFITLFVAAFMAILIYYSSTLIRRIMNMEQTSPSLGIPIWMVYVAIPVGCALMAIRTIQSCYRDLTRPGGDGADAETTGEVAELYE